MKSIAIAIFALTLCAINSISANAKTDRPTSKCEEKCHQYHCVSDPNPIYCHYACHKKCSWYGPEQMTPRKNNYTLIFSSC